MIDHIGFAVSDYVTSKAFYAQALAPLGYTLVMEATAAQTVSGYPAAGFGMEGKPDFWIGGEGKLEKPVHVAIVAKDRASVDAFYRAALAAGARDNGKPGLRPHYHPIPTATTSRPSATRRPEPTAASPAAGRGARSPPPLRDGGGSRAPSKSR